MKTVMFSTIALLFAGTAMAADAKMSWDANGDGMVSADEYMAAEDRDATFNAWDGDRDGMLSAEEFAFGNWKMFDQDADDMWNETEATAWMDSAARSGATVSQ